MTLSGEQGDSPQSEGAHERESQRIPENGQLLRPEKLPRGAREDRVEELPQRYCGVHD